MGKVEPEPLEPMTEPSHNRSLHARDQINRIVFLVALVVTAFAAGGVAVLANAEPVLRATHAFSAYVSSRNAEPTDTFWWRPAGENSTGVHNYDPARAYNGLTLYVSGHAQKAFLIEMDGTVAHQWHLDFYDVWPNAEHVSELLPEENIHWVSAHLYPNGDLLAIYVGDNVTPHGYGLIKIDESSRLVWGFGANTHHAVDVGPDGRVYALAESIRLEALPGMERIEPPILEDRVVILSSEGAVLDEIPVLEAFARSDYRAVLEFATPSLRGDITHTNDIEVLGSNAAAAHPSFAAGRLLLSMRALDTIAVLDPQTRSIVWAARGPWHMQHDPDLLANGNLLLFDNRGNLGPGGRARVIEFDPATLGIVWQYGGDEETSLWSPSASGQQRLPNGNTLITESEAARMIEVTPEREIVWEYRSPHRAGSDDELVAVLGLHAKRFSRADLKFLDE